MSELVSERRRLRRELYATAAIVLLVIAVPVGARLRRALAPRPALEQCELLVDRHLEQTLRQQRGRALSAHHLAQARAEARRRQAWDEDVQACRRDLSPDQVACGVQAGHLDDLERCLQ